MNGEETTNNSYLQWDEFEKNVIGWLEHTGIKQHGTLAGQLMKKMEEFGELAEGVAKNDLDLIEDSIGDVCFTLVSCMQVAGLGRIKFREAFIRFGDLKPSGSVVLVEEIMPDFTGKVITKSKNSDCTAMRIVRVLEGLALQYNLTLGGCLARAWNEVSKRTGYMNENGVFVKQETNHVRDSIANRGYRNLCKLLRL